MQRGLVQRIRLLPVLSPTRKSLYLRPPWLTLSKSAQPVMGRSGLVLLTQIL